MIYLTVEDVLAIHAEVVGCTEDEAEGRLRSLPRLEGALARPMWHAHYVDPDVPSLAAVLTHGLAEGQHFVDGNKRTAFLAMAVFLDRNGYELCAGGEAMAEWMVELSRGGSVEQLAAHVRGSGIDRQSGHPRTEAEDEECMPPRRRLEQRAEQRDRMDLDHHEQPAAACGCAGDHRPCSAP